jgi:pimeloyl-ACP methyl ester carboxylesterase
MKKLLRILLVLIVVGAIAFTIFWYSRPADLSFEEVKAAVPHSAYSRFADIDGVRIHYQEKGAGPALVLIHGYGSLAYTWKDVFDPLSQKFRVIAMDLKGFGFSDKPEGDYTRRAQAELVIRLLDYLEIDQAVLCGNSMGGQIALTAARYHPQRVSRLILVDSAGLNAGGTSAAPSFAYWPVIGPALAAVALTSDSMLRAWIKTAYYDPAKLTDESVAAYYRPLATRRGQRAAYLARLQGGRYPIEPEISRIQQPTLIIWGAEDQQIPLEAGRRLNAMIRGSRLVVFEHCGHVPQEEMPERFVQDVLAFAG